MIAMQNAGGTRYGWNEDFVGHVLGPLIQENSRNATGLYQLDRSFGSGVMTDMMSRGAEKYGHYTKDDELRDEKNNFKGMKAGSIAGYADMRHNSEDWALKTVLPLLGVILDALLLPANRVILAKERANIDKVPSDAADILQKNDPMLAMAAFTTSWDNLLTALGKPLVHTARRRDRGSGWRDRYDCRQNL
jgi:hypothetical protein